jgi:hypothetical protein
MSSLPTGIIAPATAASMTCSRMPFLRLPWIGCSKFIMGKSEGVGTVSSSSPAVESVLPELPLVVTVPLFVTLSLLMTKLCKHHAHLDDFPSHFQIDIHWSIEDASFRCHVAKAISIRIRICDKSSYTYPCTSPLAGHH